jgi:hypothetical protein
MRVINRLRALGGEWTYCQSGFRWKCNDGRYAKHVHTGGVDINGEAMPGSQIYVYDHGNGVPLYMLELTKHTEANGD